MTADQLRTIFLLLVTLFNCTSLSAQKSNAMSALVAREKAQTEFRQVSQLWTPANDQSINLEQYVSGAKLFDLNKAELSMLVSQRPKAIAMDIAGTGFTIELARFDILSSDFSIDEISGSRRSNYSYNPGIHYRGIVKGIQGSLAAFSFFDNKVYGLFSLPGAGNVVLALHSATGKYILYNDRDVQQLPNTGCSTDQLPVLPVETYQNKNAFSSCKDIEFYIKADYQTYLDNGSNTTDVVNYITSVFNAAAALYRNEAVYISLKHIDVNTTADVYQGLSPDPVAFLLAFGNETQNNLNGADLAVLVSTRYGSLGGVAWLRTICQPYNSSLGSGPYSFCNLQLNLQPLPAYSIDVHLMAHEPAHNIGVKHTHNCNWPGGAIDACATLEGSCMSPSPPYPASGGTIMSYCHLVSGVGVDFTNGFGQHPGDTLRAGVASAACAEYTVNRPVTTANTTMIANRECTDGNGITYYMNDGNNDDEADDRLLLKIDKNGTSIGTIDDAGFEVKVVTFANLSTGNGTSLLLPPAMPNVKNYHAAINRYWQVTPVTQPPALVEVMFPFTRGDITDADGSVTGNVPLVAADLSLYHAKPGKDPNPLTGFATAAQSDLWIFTNGTPASATQWAATSTADTFFAHFLTNSLNGGTVFYTYFPASVNDVSNADVAKVYPNPAKDHWYILSKADGVCQLYTTEGRLLVSNPVKANTVQTIDAKTFPPGAYYYKLQTATGIFTGMLLKQ